jgi:hypothetical protein
MNDTPSTSHDYGKCDGSKPDPSRDLSQSKSLKQNDKTGFVTDVTGVTGGIPSRGKCTRPPFEYDREKHPERMPASEIASRGRAVFDAFVHQFGRYVRAPTGAPEVAALWMMHTHVFGCWRVAPRLVYMSPKPECGKTTALSLMSHMAARSHPVAHTSASSLYRGISDSNPPRTWVMDEIDAYTDDARAALVNVLNSGHTEELAYIDRTGRNEKGEFHLDRMSTFAPICMATIKELPETWRSRSIIIPLQRKHPNDILQDWDTRSKEEDGLLEEVRSNAAWWGETAYPEIVASRPPMLPDGIGNREAMNMRPLFAIAELIGVDCGSAYDSLKRLVVKEPDRFEDFLAIIAELLDEQPSLTKYIHTQTILTGLSRDKRWKGLDEKGLVKQFKGTVRPLDRGVRETPKGKQLRGYSVPALRDVVAIYGAHGYGPVTSVTSVTDDDFDNEINDLDCYRSRSETVTTPVTNAAGEPIPRPTPPSPHYILENARRIVAGDSARFDAECRETEIDLWEFVELLDNSAELYDSGSEEALSLTGAANRIRDWISGQEAMVRDGSKPNGKWH